MNTSVEKPSGTFGTPGKNNVTESFGRTVQSGAQPGDSMDRMKSTDGLSGVANQAGEAVRETADQALKAGSDMVEAAKQAAANAAKAVASQASQLASSITEELGHTAEDQKAKGADAIRQFAGALKSAAGAFEAPSPMIAGYVRSTAGQIDSLSDNLKNRSVNQLITAASNLARERPVAFFAGAIAAGFAVSRLLKASAVPAASGTPDHRQDGIGRQGMSGATGQGQMGHPMGQASMGRPQMSQDQVNRQDQANRFDQANRPSGSPGGKQW